jgi:pimeloyl-ACP methyl ester carboxylesterase
MPILKLSDADIYYEVAGQGPAMMFLSATAWHCEPWRMHQLGEFSRDHRVILFDQRGTGRSKTAAKDFSTARLAADAIALLDHLGIDRAILCGHSNGGRVAQLIAIEHKERVEKLILCSAGTNQAATGIPIKLCVELVEQGYDRYVRAHAIAVGSTKSFYAKNRALVDQFIDVRMSNPPPLDIFLGHVVGRSASDTAGRLHEITAPTLIMVGDDEDHSAVDKTHSEAARIQARAIPNAKLVVMPDAGHHYPFLQPEATHRAMREFLAGG